MQQPFNSIAQQYDGWYESPKGKRIFEAELKCLLHLCPNCNGRWLEIGVGTGRFASRMGICEGIDPSPAMLALAASRDIKTYADSAEDIPFEENTFDGILIAFTLCFIAEQNKAIIEVMRVLKPGGKLLIGLVPAQSPWGKYYQQRKEAGHPIYKHANILTTDKTIEIAENAGFKLVKSSSALFCSPQEADKATEEVKPGIDKQAGFVAMLFRKPKQLLKE